MENAELKPTDATWAILNEAFKPDGDPRAPVYAANRLREITDHAAVKMFVVITNGGHWARGETLAAAADAARDAGARRTEIARAVLVMNDATPELNGAGYLITEAGSATFQLGIIGTIGSILSANKGDK